MTTHSLFEQMKALSSAEEFFDFFAVEFDPAVLRVNRLHILKRFHHYLRDASGLTTMSEGVARDTCRQLLRDAYLDFVLSTPLQEKVFPVFQKAAGIAPVRFASKPQRPTVSARG